MIDIIRFEDLRDGRYLYLQGEMKEKLSQEEVVLLKKENKFFIYEKNEWGSYWNNFNKKFKVLKNRHLHRIIFSHSYLVKINKNGRILVPEKLRKERSAFF